MKLNMKKSRIIVVLLTIIVLSTTSIALAANGVFDKIVKSIVSRDRTNVILLQDKNNEKLVHVCLGMADDDSVASFQLGLDIDVNASTEVKFNWSDNLKENYLKKVEFSGEDSEDKRLNLYYVGTKELNTNNVDEIEIGTIELSVPNNAQTNLVIAPNQEFTTISTIGHNKIKTETEPTDILSSILNESLNPLKSIKLDVTEKTINVSDVFKLNLTLTPEDTTDDRTIKWSSSDDSIAIVDTNGTVTGLKKGIAYIYAQVGNFKATCKVTVNEPKIELQKIELNKNDISLYEGQKNTLSVRYLPSGYIYKGTVNWQSSNTSVATVSNGKVLAVGEGSAIITATVKENGKTFSATCNVKVEKIPEGEIVIDEIDFELSIGHSEKLNVISNNVDTSNVTWESSDSSIVSVDSNGVVKALKEGNATITAKVGDKEATVNITAVYKKIAAIDIQPTKTKIKVKETSDVKLNIYPEDASLPLDYTLISSNPEILSVSADNKISGVSEGKSILSAKTADGTVGQVEITVVSGGLSPKTGDIAIGSVILVMLASVITIAVLIIRRNKLNKNNN